MILSSGNHSMAGLLPLKFLCLLFVITTSLASAAIEQRTFEDSELTARYANLIAELRCLVCQNQNLADSNASLARDLRDKTAEMLIAGKSDREILDYMSDRYGDFVLYRPPFRADTAALWLGPLALLLLVIIFLLRHLRNKRKNATFQSKEAQDEAERIKIRELIKNSPRLTDDKDNPK